MEIKQNMPPEAVKARLKERCAAVEAWLDTCLQGNDCPPRLREAMQYSLLAGGKRLRPVLCLSTAILAAQGTVPSVMQAQVMPFAAAIEMIHTYSLIHDDLPAMDNDDLRRGKPSSHKAFGEATAILAGDALLTDAFAFMCSSPLPAPRVLDAVACLAKAAGSPGMVGGQMLDMEYTGRDTLQLAELRRMHGMKTGALLRAACVCGALLAGATAPVLAALEAYGTALGAAFQIADDILDCTEDTATLGKPAGSDAEQGKNTYPRLLGLDQSRVLAQEQGDKAITSLNSFEGQEADFLRGLAQYVVSRVS